MATTVRQTYRHTTCRSTTTMTREVASTYDRCPHRATAFCVRCAKHAPIDEFVWVEPDGSDGPGIGA